MTEPRMLVLVPTRGRPANAERLAAACAETCTGPTDLLFVVDDNDPELAGYQARFPEHVPNLTHDGRSRVALQVQPPLERPGLAGALNAAAVPWAETGAYFAIANLGDDHLPRTRGWDTEWLTVLGQLGTGVVYGDDLIQGELMATAVGLTADIVRTLGWMAAPGMDHLCIDLAWVDLGAALGRLAYLPHTIIEHVHPAAGKAEHDAGYAHANSPAMVEHDSAAYYAWKEHQLAADVATLRAAIPTLPQPERTDP